MLTVKHKRLVAFLLLAIMLFSMTATVYADDDSDNSSVFDKMKKNKEVNSDVKDKAGKIFGTTYWTILFVIGGIGAISFLALLLMGLVVKNKSKVEEIRNGLLKILVILVIAGVALPLIEAVFNWGQDVFTEEDATGSIEIQKQVVCSLNDNKYNA